MVNTTNLILYGLSSCANRSYDYGNSSSNAYVSLIFSTISNDLQIDIFLLSFMGQWCSPLQQQHRTLVPNNSWSLPSPTLFDMFLERIMTDALEDHEGTVSIGGRTVTNLRFADDIDGLAGEEEELAKLVKRLNKAATAYGIEISAEKTKLMAKKHQ